MSVPSIGGKAAGTGWSIVTQRVVTAPNSAGILATQWEITFVTGQGQTGSVLIPQTNYNVDSVRAAVSAQALVMDQVQLLKG